MAYETKIHQAQTVILKELLFLPQAKFSELVKATKLESDHAKFHIKTLLEKGYIEKDNSFYKLTIKGKEYANKIDTEIGEIERQPKTTVMLVIERENDGVKEYLLQQRKKHPYFGFWGAPTGKIRWGEAITETATRELKEETGLDGEFEHHGVFHERVQDEITGEIIEDKIFHIMFCDNVSGRLIEDHEGSKNAWRSMKDMKNETKTYKSFYQEMNIGIKNIPYTELLHSYSREEF